MNIDCTPWTITRQDPLSTECSRQEYQRGYTFPSPGDLPHPGISPGSLALQVDSLLSELSGKPQLFTKNLNIQLYFLLIPTFILEMCSSRQVLISLVESEWQQRILTFFFYSVLTFTSFYMCFPIQLPPLLETSLIAGVICDICLHILQHIWLKYMLCFHLIWVFMVSGRLLSICRDVGYASALDV